MLESSEEPKNFKEWKYDRIWFEHIDKDEADNVRLLGNHSTGFTWSNSSCFGFMAGGGLGWTTQENGVLYVRPWSEKLELLKDRNLSKVKVQGVGISPQAQFSIIGFKMNLQLMPFHVLPLSSSLNKINKSLVLCNWDPNTMRQRSLQNVLCQAPGPGYASLQTYYVTGSVQQPSLDIMLHHFFHSLNMFKHQNTMICFAFFI